MRPDRTTPAPVVSDDPIANLIGLWEPPSRRRDEREAEAAPRLDLTVCSCCGAWAPRLADACPKCGRDPYDIPF